MTKPMLAAAALLLSSTLFAADAGKGKEVFETNCAVCHNADSAEVKMGPGLKGLFKKSALNNKKKPSDATVMSMINEGGNGMPGFADQLTATEKADLLAYLKTL
jgi:cytochrome c